MNNEIIRIKKEISWLEGMLPVMITEEAKKNLLKAIDSYKGLLASY